MKAQLHIIFILSAPGNRHISMSLSPSRKCKNFMLSLVQHMPIFCLFLSNSSKILTLYLQYRYMSSEVVAYWCFGTLLSIISL
jgi:hypothetical protein